MRTISNKLFLIQRAIFRSLGFRHHDQYNNVIMRHFLRNSSRRIRKDIKQQKLLGSKEIQLETNKKNKTEKGE
jgi:hypothetical protein